jgi:hypothetical protein
MVREIQLFKSHPLHSFSFCMFPSPVLSSEVLRKIPAKAVKQSLGMSNIILSSKTSFSLTYPRYYEMVSILFFLHRKRDPK